MCLTSAGLEVPLTGDRQCCPRGVCGLSELMNKRMRHKVFSKGNYGPLGKILCPSNWWPRMAHSSQSPLPTPDLWVLGLPTHKLGLLRGGPLR